MSLFLRSPVGIGQGLHISQHFLESAKQIVGAKSDQQGRQLFHLWLVQWMRLLQHKCRRSRSRKSFYLWNLLMECLLYKFKYNNMTRADLSGSDRSWRNRLGGQKQTICSTEQARGVSACSGVSSRQDAWAHPGGHQWKMCYGAAWPAGVLGEGRACAVRADHTGSQNATRRATEGWRLNDGVKVLGYY